MTWEAKKTMANWEFFIQKEGDRPWISVSSPQIEVAEGRYRAVVRCPHVNVAVRVRIVYRPDGEGEPRVWERSRQTNQNGLTIALGYTFLRSGTWQLRCSAIAGEEEEWQGIQIFSRTPAEADGSAPVDGLERDDSERDDLEPADAEALSVPDSPPALPEVCVALSQDTYAIKREREFFLSGRVTGHLPAAASDGKAGFQGNREVASEASARGLYLEVRLQNPQTGKAIARTQHPLRQPFPFPFAFKVTIPPQINTRLILGEAIARTAGGDVLSKQSFTVMTDLNDLYSVLEKNADELPDPSLKPRSPLASVNLAFLDLVENPRTDEPLEVRPKNNQVLPPKIEKTKTDPTPHRFIELPFTRHAPASPAVPTFDPDRPPEPVVASEETPSASQPEVPEPNVPGTATPAPEISNSEISDSEIPDSKASKSELSEAEVLQSEISKTEIPNSEESKSKQPKSEEPEATLFRSPEVPAPAATSPQEDAIGAPEENERESQLNLNFEKDKLADEMATLVTDELSADGFKERDKEEREDISAVFEEPLEEAEPLPPPLGKRFLARMHSLARDPELHRWLEEIPPAPPEPAENAYEAALENGNDRSEPAESIISPELEANWEEREIVVEDLPERFEAESAPRLATEVDPNALPVPVPELTVLEDELVAGRMVRAIVKVPMMDDPPFVKLWLRDRQTRAILDGPALVREFSPNGLGAELGMVEMTIPYEAIEVSFEAIAIEKNTLRESYKQSLECKVRPPKPPSLPLRGDR